MGFVFPAGLGGYAATGGRSGAAGPDIRFIGDVGRQQKAAFRPALCPLKRNASQLAQTRAPSERPLHNMVTLPANCRQSPLPTRGKLNASRGTALVYKMIAERDNETVK